MLAADIAGMSNGATGAPGLGLLRAVRALGDGEEEDGDLGEDSGEDKGDCLAGAGLFGESPPVWPAAVAGLEPLATGPAAGIAPELLLGAAAKLPPTLDMFDPSPAARGVTMGTVKAAGDACSISKSESRSSPLSLLLPSSSPGGASGVAVGPGGGRSV